MKNSGLALTLVVGCALVLAVTGCDRNATAATTARETVTDETALTTVSTNTAGATAAPNTWTNLNPTTGAEGGPVARANSSMVYDSASGRVILFGGMDSGGIFLNDTWAYEPIANTWADLEPSGSLPATRALHSMVYDSASDKVILFGGMDNGGKFQSDTWAYDPIANTWTNLNPSGNRPVARTNSSMVYDPDSGKVILFGGMDVAFLMLGDTWVYDPTANSWAELTPTGSSPTARAGHAMVYEPGNGKVILFGGKTDTGFLNDTWAYDPAANSWTELNPSGTPPSARAFDSLAYDPSSHKAILFGGQDGSAVLRDTWDYDPTANAWTNLHPAGNLPSARGRYAMVYGLGSGGVILFGGYDASPCANDTWAYGPGH